METPTNPQEGKLTPPSPDKVVDAALITTSESTSLKQRISRSSIYLCNRMSSKRKRNSSDTSPSSSDFERDQGNLKVVRRSSKADPVGKSTIRKNKTDDAKNVENDTKEDEKLLEERIIQTVDAKNCLNLLSSMSATDDVPYRPIGGHMYVYEWSRDQDFDDDWKRDGYNWRDYGKKSAFDGAFTVHTLVARIGSKVEGRYPKSSISNSFKKKAYSHPSFPRKVLVCYIGDESVDVQRAHGNTKNTAKMDVPFNSTHKKVMRKIASMPGKPATVFKNAFLSGSEDVRSIPTTQVRDKQQVSNIQRSERKRSDDGSTGKEDYIDEDLASFSMGRKLVRENKVEWFPQTKSFLVQAEGGPFVVKMFPRPSCSCKVEQGSCSHVLAIKVGLGIPAKKTKISSIAKVRQHQQSKDDKTAKNRNRGLKDVEIEQPNQENCDADSSELELLKELTKKSKPPFHSKKKNKRATFIEKRVSSRKFLSSKTDRANNGMDPSAKTPEYQAADYEMKLDQKHASNDYYQTAHQKDDKSLSAQIKDICPEIESSGRKDKPSTSHDSCIGKKEGSKANEIEIPFSLRENIFIEDSGHVKISTESDIDDECKVICKENKSTDVSQYEILEIIQQTRGSERPSDPREDRFFDESGIYKIGDEKYQLTDLEMNTALTLLRKLARDLGLKCRGLMNVDWAYPAYPGAYDNNMNGSIVSANSTAFGEKSAKLNQDRKTTSEERKMIQLLHNGDAKCGHWMVACQGFFDSPNIRGGKKTKDSYLPRVAIFDSLGVHYSNNPHVLASCASLLRSEAPFFVDIRDCQYQGDTSSCGVFSIAFATSILYGKNPTILVFDKPQMREHLMSCFKKGKLTEFPKVAGLKGIPKGRKLLPLDSIKVDPICNCRRPKHFLNTSNPKWENIVRCDTCLGEYHYKCVGLDELAEKEAEQKMVKWMCGQCDAQ